MAGERSLTRAQRALLREIDLHDDCEVVLNFRWGQQINRGRSAYRMGYSNGRAVQSRIIERLETLRLVAVDEVPCETRGVRLTEAGRIAARPAPSSTETTR